MNNSNHWNSVYEKRILMIGLLSEFDTFLIESIKFWEIRNQEDTFNVVYEGPLK